MFTPRSVARDSAAQATIDQQTASLALYQYEACPFCVKVRLNVLLELVRICGHIDVVEELLIITLPLIDELVVDIGRLQPIERQYQLLQDPELDGAVDQVVVLELCHRLDLDQVYPVPDNPNQDIGPNQYTFRLKGRFEQGEGTGLLQQLLSFPERLTEFLVVPNQNAVGKPRLGGFAYPMTDREGSFCGW